MSKIFVEKNNISANKIARLLDKRDNIYVYESLESTNKTAKEMAINGATHGTTIIANSQTRGRGRRGRKFFSPPNTGIYMSIIIHNKQFDLSNIMTVFTAVCVCEAIIYICDVDAKIKWINDIFLDNKKIAGILTETSSAEWAVIGIGINFNTSIENLPSEIKNIAGSIFNGTTNIERNTLIADIINRILTQKYNQNQIIQKYKQNMLAINKKILVLKPNETFEAIALDIDNMGQLIVKKNNGEIVTLCSGEISILL